MAKTAASAGISTSYLSSLENGNNLASLPILARLATVLELPLNAILRDLGGQHAATRHELATHTAGLQDLSRGDLQLTVRALVAPAGASGPAPLAIAGNDLFVYALSGNIQLTIDTEPHTLRPGDSLDAELPHTATYTIPGPDASVSIWATAASAHPPSAAGAD